MASAFPPIPPMEERNFGGICHVDVVPSLDVLVMPEQVDGVIATPVLLKAGASWSRLSLEEDAGTYNEKWIIRNGAQYSTARLSGAVAKDRLRYLQALWGAKGSRFLALIRTRNGDQLLMGSPKTPAMLLTSERAAGAPLEARNQYELAITLSSRDPIPFYLQPPLAVVPTSCPTLAQLLPQATLEELLAGITAEQTEQLAASFSGSCPTLVQLIATATNAELFAALSTAQAIYIANQIIDVIDGGDASGDENNTPPAGQFSPAGFSPTSFRTT